MSSKPKQPLLNTATAQTSKQSNTLEIKKRSEEARAYALQESTTAGTTKPRNANNSKSKTTKRKRKAASTSTSSSSSSQGNANKRPQHQMLNGNTNDTNTTTSIITSSSTPGRRKVNSMKLPTQTKSTVPPRPSSFPPPVMRQSSHIINENEDYANFVRSLGSYFQEDEPGKEKDDKSISEEEDEEDEEEYQQEEGGEEEDDDDDSEGTGQTDHVMMEIGQGLRTPDKYGLQDSYSANEHHHQVDPLDDFHGLEWDHEALEAELGSLLDEDMEAAVNTLLNGDTDMKGKKAPKGKGAGKKKVTPSPASVDSTTIASAATSKKQALLGTPQQTAMEIIHSTPISSTSSPLVPSSVASSPHAYQYQHQAQHPLPTDEQIQRLQKLMSQHYQILLQQSVMAIRAAHGNKFQRAQSQYYLQTSQLLKSTLTKPNPPEEFFGCGETSDDLAEIVDGAVTMLQDLDENRKDAIRYSIQMSRARRATRFRGQGHGGSGGLPPLGSRVIRTILPNDESCGASMNSNQYGEDDTENEIDREKNWLTRSAFTKTLEQNDWDSMSCSGSSNNMNAATDREDDSNYSRGGASTTFGVRGLPLLKETFATIDDSMRALTQGPLVGDRVNIFDEAKHGSACEQVLKYAQADYDTDLIPGYRDITELISYPAEVLINSSNGKLTKEQEIQLRKNKCQFTAAEDNLLLRGVNLYGEKEWALISDRFLPDRPVSIIAQRYWRLCLLIYRANGVHIDSESGELPPPPDHPNGAEDFDEQKIAATLKPVKAPMICDVYSRWSLEEDIAILKSVPLMGRMFAEISKRLMPHRDRGALRKRYQVLERRVKAAVKKEKKTPTVKKKNSTQSAVRPLASVPSCNAVQRQANGGAVKSAVSSSVKKNTNTLQEHATKPMTNSAQLQSHPPMLNKYSPVQRKSSLPDPDVEVSNSANSAQSDASSITNAFSPIQPNPTFLMRSTSELEGSKSDKPVEPNADPTTADVPSTSIESNILPTSNEIKSPQMADLTSKGYGENSTIESSVQGSTRTGFERIIEGEWSQMSSVQKLIEGNETNKNLTTNKPDVAERELPKMQMDDNSMSGLSMLNEFSALQPSVESEQQNRNSKKKSIMSSVLGRTKENPRNLITPSESSKEISNDAVHDNLKLLSPKTPTPTKLKDGPLETNISPTRFSPSNINGGVSNLGPTLDGFTFSNFGMEDSQRAMEKQSPITPLQGIDTGLSQTFPSMSNSAFKVGTNSLMATEDLDAITALNQMSNSNTGVPNTKDAAMGMSEKEKQIADESTNGANTGKRSLFQSVVSKGRGSRSKGGTGKKTRRK